MTSGVSGSQCENSYPRETSDPLTTRRRAAVSSGDACTLVCEGRHNQAQSVSLDLTGTFRPSTIGLCLAKIWFTRWSLLVALNGICWYGKFQS